MLFALCRACYKRGDPRYSCWCWWRGRSRRSTWGFMSVRGAGTAHLHLELYAPAPIYQDEQ